MIFVGFFNGVEEPESWSWAVLDVFNDVALVGVCRWEDAGGGASAYCDVGWWEARGVHYKVSEGVSVGGTDSTSVREEPKGCRKPESCEQGAGGFPYVPVSNAMGRKVVRKTE
jgi:hypothetical protein